MVLLKEHVNTYSPFKAAVEEDVKCPSAHILALVIFIAAIALYSTITFIRFARQVVVVVGQCRRRWYVNGGDYDIVE